MFTEIDRTVHSVDTEDAPEILVTDLSKLPDLDLSSDSDVDGVESKV